MRWYCRWNVSPALTKNDRNKFRSSEENSDEYEKVTSIIDSGTVTTVMPKRQCAHVPIKETSTSPNGTYYTDASGNEIYNEGQRDTEGLTTEGVPLELAWQVAKISRPLISVREMKASGNAAIFGLNEEHAVINKRTEDRGVS